MKKILLVFALGVFVTSCGPSNCDCANATKDQLEDDSFTEKCEKLEDGWKAKYKEADKDEKKSMRVEMKACGEE